MLPQIEVVHDTDKVQLKMTEMELNEKVHVQWVSKYGCYQVEIIYYGKAYDCLSHNTTAVNAIRCKGGTKQYRTRKEALQALYDEVKQTHGLK